MVKTVGEIIIKKFRRGVLISEEKTPIIDNGINWTEDELGKPSSPSCSETQDQSSSRSQTK